MVVHQELIILYQAFFVRIHLKIRKREMLRLGHYVIQDFAYANLHGWLSVRELKLSAKLSVININVNPIHQS